MNQIQNVWSGGIVTRNVKKKLTMVSYDGMSSIDKLILILPSQVSLEESYSRKLLLEGRSTFNDEFVCLHTWSLQENRKKDGTTLVERFHIWSFCFHLFQHEYFKGNISLIYLVTQGGAGELTRKLSIINAKINQIFEDTSLSALFLYLSKLFISRVIVLPFFVIK